MSVHIHQVGDFTQALGECVGAGPAVVAAMTKAAMNGSEKDDNGVVENKWSHGSTRLRRSSQVTEFAVRRVHSFYFILWLHADLIRPFSTFGFNAPPFFDLF